MRLSGHHAVVTGGGTGIGAAVARVLAAEGARLTLVGRRKDKLEDVATALPTPKPAFPELVPSTPPVGVAQDKPWPAAKGLPFLPTEEQDRPSTSSGKTVRGRPGVAIAMADVTDRAQVETAVNLAREKNGPVTILVNNAGAAQGIPFAKVTERLWRDMLAVNLDGMFHCCQAALPDLLAAERGRIVTVASMAGLHGFAYAAPYIAAKHGAIGLTRALAAEYARTNLRVNAVCPGFVDSDMTAGSVANIQATTGRSAEEARAGLAALNPSGRLIAPEEVAAAVLDLILSDRNGEAVEIA